MTNMFVYPKPDMFFDFAVQNQKNYINLSAHSVNYFILT